MTENKLEKELVGLFETTIKALKEKISTGEYTASDMKNAIELLKNNNITCDEKTGEIPDGLLDDLPFESELRVVK